jgi:protein-disulfide isomerase
MRLRTVLLGLFGLLLAACGAYAPAAPTRSSVEERQTARALQGAPTLPPLAGGGPTATPRPTPDLRILAAPPADPRALGDPNAPITLVEFSDFE